MRLVATVVKLPSAAGKLRQVSKSLGETRANRNIKRNMQNKIRDIEMKMN